MYNVASLIPYAHQFLLTSANCHKLNFNCFPSAFILWTNNVLIAGYLKSHSAQLVWSFCCIWNENFFPKSQQCKSPSWRRPFGVFHLNNLTRPLEAVLKKEEAAVLSFSKRDSIILTESLPLTRHKKSLKIPRRRRWWWRRRTWWWRRCQWCQPVWPDDEIKRCLIFPILPQKYPNHFYLKVELF